MVEKSSQKLFKEEQINIQASMFISKECLYCKKASMLHGMHLTMCYLMYCALLDQCPILIVY
jgi:hypothetical protein